MGKDRWQKLTATTPDGTGMYVCANCGRLSVSKDETCPQPAEVDHDGVKIYIPCDEWPVDKEKFLATIKDVEGGKECLFSGHVVLADGTKIPVTAPIKETMARTIVSVDAEIKLGEQAKAEAREKARNDMMEEAKDPTSYKKRFKMKYNEYLDQYRKAKAEYEFQQSRRGMYAHEQMAREAMGTTRVEALQQQQAAMPMNPARIQKLQSSYDKIQQLKAKGSGLIHHQTTDEEKY
jgi:hypothetical protein